MKPRSGMMMRSSLLRGERRMKKCNPSRQQSPSSSNFLSSPSFSLSFSPSFSPVSSSFSKREIHGSIPSKSLQSAEEILDVSKVSLQAEQKTNTNEKVTTGQSMKVTIGQFVKPFESIPGPKGIPLIGNVWRYFPIIGKFRADKLDQTGRILLNDYGPIVREHVFGKLNVVHLFDPNDMESMFRSEGKYPERRSHRAIGKYRIDRPETYSSGGIFCENGPEWYRLRKISQQSLLNPNNVNSYIPDTETITNELVNLIRIKRDYKFEMSDFQYDLYKWSLENISQITLETRFGCLASELPEDSNARKLIKAAHLVIESVMNTEVGQTDLWRYFPTKMYRQLCTNEDLMASIVSNVLREKKVYLDTLLRKNREELTNVEFKSGVIAQFFSDPKTTFGDVLATVLDLMLAGIDTTAFSAGFVLYYLARNPKVQEKLRNEIFSILKNSESGTEKFEKITPDILNKLPYMKAVVKESMRLAPLSIGIGRVTTTPIVIRNYQIPIDTMVITQNQVACKLEQNFDRPEEFIPERWLNLRRQGQSIKQGFQSIKEQSQSIKSIKNCSVNKKNDNPTRIKTNPTICQAEKFDETKVSTEQSFDTFPKPHPFLALPFGYGPRSCPGRRVSDMNTYVLLVKLLTQFRIEYHYEDIGLVTRLINIPDKPMQFRFIDIE